MLTKDFLELIEIINIMNRVYIKKKPYKNILFSNVKHERIFLS